MVAITAMRMNQPAPAAATPAPQAAAGSRQPEGQAVRPVATTVRVDAAQQPAATSHAVVARLAERDESAHPAGKARAAAEAAREAYIRASIAAGVSPLPLPGL